MINISFTHFEGFGGALVNNLVGTVSNGITQLLQGFLTDPIAMFSGAILIILGLIFYLILKGKPSEIYTLIFGTKLYDNVLVRLLAIYFIAFALLQPIPVVQMTPVVAYETDATASGVDSKDRAIVGWIINDIKTTTTFTGEAAVSQGTLQEVQYVPLIMAPLGWFQSAYYGFPDFDVEDFIIPKDQHTDPEMQEGEIPYFYKAPASNSGLPSMVACLPNPQEILDEYENNFKARLDFGSIDKLTSTCKANYGIGGEWRKEVENALITVAFGEQSVSEIMSDFFEPIDRVFFYMTAQPATSVIHNYLQIDASNTIPSAYINELEGKWESYSPSFWNSAINDLYAADKAIDEKILSIAKKLKTLKEVSPGKAFPGEIVLAVEQQFLENDSIKDAWRRNLAAKTDKEAEAKAIPQTPIGSVADGNEKIIRTAEKEFLQKAHEIGGVASLPLTNLEEPTLSVDNPDDILVMRSKIYKDAAGVLGMEIPPHVLSDKYLAGATRITGDEALNELNKDQKKWFRHKAIDTNPSNFTAPSSIQTTTFKDFNGDGVTSEIYKTINSELWAVERTLRSRAMLLEYITSLESAANAILEVVQQDVARCEQSKDCDKTEPKSIKTSSVVSVSKSDGSSDSLKIPMVYAGIYPSQIYLGLSTQERKSNPADTTGKVLILPLEGVLDKITVKQTDPSLAAHQKPIYRFSDLVPSDFWQSNQASVKGFVEDNQTGGLSRKIMEKALTNLTSFLSATEFTGNVKQYDGTGVVVDYKALNKKHPMLGDNFRVVVEQIASVKQVTFETETVDFSKLNDYFGRKIAAQDFVSTTAPMRDEKFKEILATINGLAKSFSASLSSIESQARFIDSFYLLVDTFFPYTEVDGADLVFKPEYREDLAVIFNSVGIDSNKLATEYYIDNLFELIEGKAAQYKTSLDQYSKDGVKNGTITVSTLSAPEKISDFIVNNHIAYLKKSDFHAQSLIQEKHTAIFEPVSECSAVLDLSPVELKKADIKACAKAFDSVGDSDTKAVLIKAFDSETAFPASESNYNTYMTAISRVAWAGTSAVLDLIREFQNTAVLKVQNIRAYSSPAYRTTMFMGAVHPSVQQSMVDAAINSSEKHFVNPQYQPPSLGESLDVLVASISDAPIEDTLVSAATLAMIGVGAAFSVLIALLLGAAIMVFRLVKFLLLAVLTSGLGFIMASFVFPLSLVLWMISHNIFTKKPYEGLESLAQSPLIQPKRQLTLAYKMLSVWVVIFTIMIAILMVDHLLIEKVMETVALKSWIYSAAGDSFYFVASTILILSITAIYVVLLGFGYSKAKEYLVSISYDTPEMKKAMDMFDRMGDVYTSMMTRLGNKLKTKNNDKQ